MINPIEFLTPENLEKAQGFIDELKDQFGLTQDDNYQGYLEIAAILIGAGVPQAFIAFFKMLSVMQVQLSGLMDTLNSYYGAAESAFKTGAKAVN